VTRAVKVLHRDTPGLGSTLYGDAELRFRLEAQLGDRLNHPHIVRVYDFSELPEALVLVMEYASGGSLSDRLAQARKAKQPGM
jgi:serine/threonine protein kinase